MRKILPLLLVLLSVTGQAQTYTVGLRGGAVFMREQRNRLQGSEVTTGNPGSGAVEAFLRRTSKSRWAFELSAGLARYSYEVALIEDDTEPGPRLPKIPVQTTNGDLTLSIQRDITGAFLKKGASPGRFHNYIAFTLTATAASSRRKNMPFPYSSVKDGWETAAHENKIWTGLSNTLTCNLSPKFQLSAVAYVRIQPTDFFMSGMKAGLYFEPVTKAGLMIGAGYRL
jgi:hypothetical protein